MDTTEIRLQALITRREAMLQANRERESHGYADAYGEDSLLALENDMLALCPIEIAATPCPRCEANAEVAPGDGDPAAPSLVGPCLGDDRPAWRQEVGELLAAMTPGTNASRIGQILDAHVAEDAAREERHAKVREAAKQALHTWDNPPTQIGQLGTDLNSLRATLEEDK